jgi:hypothetical protein
MTVSNIYIEPQDNWVAVTSAGVDFIRISRYPATHPLFVATGSSAPSLVGENAEGVITFGGQPNDTGTVTIGDITYTFVAAFDDPGDYDVLIGANQAASEAALTAAINGRAAIPATAAEGEVIFAGGVPTANDTVTIGAEVYTFVASAAVPFDVTIGANETETGDNLEATILADSEIVSGSNAAGTVTITALTAGFAGNSISLAESADNTTVSGANLTGGNDEGPAITAHTEVTAADGAGTVTVTSILDGVRGNEIAFAENASNITVDGSGFLTGGLDALKGVLLDCGEVFWVDVPEADNFYVRNPRPSTQPLRVDVYYNAT